MTASAGNLPGRIFMSYRREDTAYPAGWLYERLAGHFARSQVFKDIDSIELGDDFVEVITTAVGSCDVLLALIGDRWLTVTAQDGRRRLDNPDDFVRLEIEAALARDVRVIPILVEGARMPRADELPASLSKLARRQALELSPSWFDIGTERLLRVLERTIKEAQEQARKQAEEAAQREAEETARLRQPAWAARREAEETARRQAEEAAQREAEETARRQAEEAAQREAEEAARRQAEEAAQREAEETARRQAEEAARREAEETAQREAEETARRQAEEAARREAEETAQREAEEAARRQAEEAARREAEETARRQAEETARRQAEETARRQAEEAARRQAEETARRQAEETARRQAEETARRQAKETARREAEETAQREAEETARREAEETARRQAEAVPAAVRPDEPAGEPDLLTAAAGTDVLAPVQPGLPDPGPATTLVEPQPAGTLPAEIPPPRAGPSEPPTVGTIEPAPGGGLPDEDGGTPSSAVAAVAGNGMPAAAATAATDHPLASTLETAAGSGDSTGKLGRLTVPVSGGDGAPPVQRPPRRRGPVTAWIRRHRLPVFALACATLAAAVTVPLISSSPPSSSRPAASPSPSISARPAAIGFGWVSLGNLSQTPSPVDVYLYSSGNSSPQFVQHGVAYGTILPYHAVNAGDYTVKVRAAGASASSNPAWSVSLIVRAGGAYTVAPLRATAQQGQLKVIDNDLTAPTGKSLVRVIQADLNQGQVTFHCSCAAGAPGNITTDAAPGTVSPQTPIPAGTWTMTATGPSAKTSLPVTLTDGTVHNEIVISKPGGGIEIINLVQAPPSYQRVPVDLPFAGPAPHNIGGLQPLRRHAGHSRRQGSACGISPPRTAPAFSATRSRIRSRSAPTARPWPSLTVLTVAAPICGMSPPAVRTATLYGPRQHRCVLGRVHP